MPSTPAMVLVSLAPHILTVPLFYLLPTPPLEVSLSPKPLMMSQMGKSGMPLPSPLPNCSNHVIALKGFRCVHLNLTNADLQEKDS